MPVELGDRFKVVRQEPERAQPAPAQGPAQPVAGTATLEAKLDQLLLSQQALQARLDRMEANQQELAAAVVHRTQKP